MKILVLLGSPRKKDSYKIIEQVEERMKQKGEVDFEYIRLNKLHIEECKGCELCFVKGEAHCPLKDELGLLVQKLKEADGIIFTTPVYACHITGSFKKVVDRLSYLFHRPEFIGKPALSIVTTAGGGIGPTSKYLKMLACGWGCNLVGQINLVTPRYFKGRWQEAFYSPKYRAKMDSHINKQVEVFCKVLENKELPKPSFYDIYLFNGLKSKTYTSKVDYDFWAEKGWLNKPYYYEEKLNLAQKIFSMIMDKSIKMMASKMGLELAGEEISN